MAEGMTVYDLAKKYYLRLWPKSRIDALVKAGRLTQAEAEEIISVKEAE